MFIIYGNQVEGMVRQLVEKTGTMDRLRPDDRVMIKPNLLVSREKWVGINTDPRVVEALVKSLKERGVHRITVGDGSGMGYSAIWLLATDYNWSISKRMNSSKSQLGLKALLKAWRLLEPFLNATF
jgi:uncharacterized protein (DUF362 family)